MYGCVNDAERTQGQQCRQYDGDEAGPMEGSTGHHAFQSHARELAVNKIRSSPSVAVSEIGNLHVTYRVLTGPGLPAREIGRSTEGYSAFIGFAAPGRIALVTPLGRRS